MQRAAGFKQGAILTCAPILAVMGFVLVAPVLVSMRNHFSAVPNHEIWVPMVMTAPALCIALLSPLAGVLDDRFGPRRILLISLALYAVLGTAPLYLNSLVLIVATRFGVGVTEAGILTCTIALVGAYYQGDERQKWIAYGSGAAPAAATIFLLLGGAIGSGGWRFPFFGYAFSILVLIGVAKYTWEPAAARAVQGRSAALPWRHVFKVAAFAVFASFVFYIIPVELGFVLSDRGVQSPSMIGLLIAIGTASVPVGTLLSRPLVRFPVGIVLAGTIFVMGSGLLLAASGRSIWMIALGVVLHQMSGGVMLPTAMNYALNGFSAQAQGRGTGIWWSTYFIAQFLTPITITITAAAVGSLEGSLVAFAVLCFLLSLPIALFLRPLAGASPPIQTEP
jgi:MFS family permease